ncbi:MAG: S8 family serine peptidase [Saprospiraceae bacterium]|nr:S8 family serine peptidase [Saprospiraceae bacterium]
MKQFLWFLILIPTFLVSQNTFFDTKGVIVVTDEHNINDIAQKYIESRNFGNLQITNLGEGTETYLLTAEIDDITLYQWCLDQKNIAAAELNYKLTPRIKPNDGRVGEQYYLDFIKAYDAWNITTGGKDFKGQDIVIGIVDDGFDVAHEDLTANIYLNASEIAGDNKDNDGNGYIDDVNGWNQRTKRGVHDLKSHGTNILGVMGAQGNNQMGIAGVNWSVKLLPVTTGTYVNDVIESYNYFVALKKLYNNSNGSKGANILVVSYSGGLPKAFAKDHPIWCSTYDKLGAEGIISVAATTNENDNVEEVGDMPSTCTSPYLLIVNSTNKNDEKDTSTGFGAISVDIAAPGERILTTDLVSKGTYKTETGTSLSTPMVAGAAALLYAIKCELFYQFTISNKAESVLAIKDALLSGVDVKTSLKNKTVSGGRLNILNSMNIILEKYCGRGPLAITSVTLNNNVVTVNYIAPNNDETILKIYDSTGREVCEQRFFPPVSPDKTIVVDFEKYYSGLYYFVTLISGKDIVSKGFTVKDSSK